MDVSGVTESGARGARNPLRGGRDRASEGSGSGDSVIDPPPTEGRMGPIALERGAPGDGGGDGRAIPIFSPAGYGGVETDGDSRLCPRRIRGGGDGRGIPVFSPAGYGGGEDGRGFPSLPPQDTGGMGADMSPILA